MKITCDCGATFDMELGNNVQPDMEIGQVDYDTVVVECNKCGKVTNIW